MSEAATITAVESTAEPTSKLRSIGLFTGYGLFFLAALVVSLVLTFPNRQLKGFVESQARKAGYPMAIERMALTGLGGVALEGIKLSMPQPKGKNGKRKPGEATIVSLDEVTASVALWPLISRSEVNAQFSLHAGDGMIESGHVVVRQGPAKNAGASKRRKKGRKGKKGKDAAKNAAAKAGSRTVTWIDLDIPAIDHIDLAKMGLAERMLGFTDKVGGELQGSLSGAITLHWEGSHEGARGNIDLELTDAVLHNPSIAIDTKGPPLELQDLRLGVVTVKVRIDEKGRINLLKGKRGVDSSTAIHLAGVDIFGRDLELVAEERSHIIIPPGRSGMRQARMHIHLVFALPKTKPAAKRPGAKKAEADDATSNGRASWDMVREMMNGKFKRFMRSGYLGITCSGALTHPICAPSLPQVTVGTRKRARSEARAKAKKDGAKAKRDAAAKKAELAQAAAKKKTEEARKKAAATAAAAATKKAAKKAAATKSINGKKVDFAPVVRPGAKTKPTPRGDGALDGAVGGAKGGVKVDQANEKTVNPDEADDEDDEADLDEADDEDDEGGDATKAAAKKKALAQKKKVKGDPDEEDLEEEGGEGE